MPAKTAMPENTSMPVNSAKPANGAMSANTAMPMFLTSCETDRHCNGIKNSETEMCMGSSFVSRLLGSRLPC